MQSMSVSRWAPRFRAHPRGASGLHRWLLNRLPRFAYEPLDTNHSDSGVISKKNHQIMLYQTTEDGSKIRKDADTWPADGIWHASIIENSSHRDGAIYNKNWGFWGMGCPVDLADCSETLSELKNYSKAMPCYPDQENCMMHLSNEMLQIFSLRLTKTPINSGPIQLYGYLDARDYMDGLFNYVFNRSRDNPVIVHKGSLIEMAGPKRGIVMLSEVLMEFDTRIKTGAKEEDDLQLIDGLINFDERMSTRPTMLRFNGSCGGAVDMCLALIEKGMEAVIEVAILEVQSAFNLSLSSFVSIMEEEEHKEIQLFHGPVGEMCTKRFVVAVAMDTMMHFKFRVGKKGCGCDSVYFCSFDANRHGCVDRLIKLEAACISVKVTVSPSL
ncbi:unnamed protein product [Urochloa decumbens]|uniref:DUF6598 domain-containing protein n=1 Tax=Urochloa decumbens TaxID=240449 RepID=A0ABC9AKH5_9POAL